MNTLKFLHRTFIQPYILYLIKAWYTADKTDTNHVFMIQKKAIRLISKIGYRDYTASHFNVLNTLKCKLVIQIANLHICI